MNRSTALALALAGAVTLVLASHPTARAASASKTLAPLGGATTWFNGRVTPTSLRGKVVLVDVFTIECINCINVTPNLRSLTARLSGSDFAVVGVHTPETKWQHDRSTVVSNLSKLGVTWPVAIDNDYAIWSAYNVNAWPTQLLFDRHGQLRKTFVGDSQDAEVDAAVDALLHERG